MLRIMLVLGLVFLAAPSCDDVFSTVVVTAQLTRSLAPESNTGSILIGKASVQNVFRDDWLLTPDPGDTTFDLFPAKIEPMSGAQVKVNGATVGQRLPGVYFNAGMSLPHLGRYDLEITTPEGKTITSHAFLPDSFTILQPQPGDSFGPGPVNATWSRSESCEVFLVGVTPADSGSAAMGWSDARRDTFCEIPSAAFQDSLGGFVPGHYIFSVSAINGAWNKPGLDLLFSGGNVQGALGTFGCAVLSAPVLFRVR